MLELTTAMCLVVCRDVAAMRWVAVGAQATVPGAEGERRRRYGGLALWRPFVGGARGLRWVGRDAGSLVWLRPRDSQVREWIVGFSND